MSAKSENAFQSVVTEALEKMKNASAGASSYAVHRANGECVVRREARVAEKGFAELTYQAAVSGAVKPES